MIKKTVSLNSKVTLRCNNIKKSYQLVSSDNLDTSNIKISNISPLGKLLLNSKVKDIIKVKTPNGDIEYEVVSIENKR